MIVDSLCVNSIAAQCCVNLIHLAMDEDVTGLCGYLNDRNTVHVKETS